MARALAIAAVLIATLAGALHSWLPNLGQQREQITSSPGLEPLFGRADVRLAGGQTLCVGPITLDPSTAIAQTKITPGAVPPRRLKLTVTGDGGYRSAAGPTAAPVGRDLQPVAFRIASPPRTINATACLHNRDRRTIAVLATNEPRSQTAAETTVDGRLVADDDATLLLLEAQPASMRDRAGTIVARMSAFAGGWLAPWLLWFVLAGFVALGVVAMIAGFGADGRRDR